MSIDNDKGTICWDGHIETRMVHVILEIKGMICIIVS